jgi:hypothetical protein
LRTQTNNFDGTQQFVLTKWTKLIKISPYLSGSRIKNCHYSCSMIQQPENDDFKGVVAKSEQYRLRQLKWTFSLMSREKGETKISSSSSNKFLSNL